MTTDILFFDLSNEEAPPTPLSLHTWKVRLAMNTKGLNYTTHWVSYLEIERTLKAHGIKPTGTKPDGSPRYTVPAIIDRTNRDEGEHVRLADSTPIIEYLEKAYPTPGVDLLCVKEEGKGTRGLMWYMEETMLKELFVATQVDLFGIGVYERCKDDAQREVIKTVIERAFGKKVEEIEKRGEEREQVWKKLEGALGKVAGAYERNGGGRFLVEGDTPTLIDVRLAGLIIWARLLRPGEAWKRIGEWHDGRWKRLFEWFEDYMVVDGRKIHLD